MPFLIDTNVISDFVRSNKGVINSLHKTSPGEVFISSITLMEVKYGLLLNPEKAIKIEPVINDLISAIRILPFTEKEAVVAAQVRSTLKSSGKPIGPFDLLIAATSITHQLTMVTANLREFMQVPNLQVMNWRT
jgi:tRNA(fMet)-specific endonuclease VapC